MKVSHLFRDRSIGRDGRLRAALALAGLAALVALVSPPATTAAPSVSAFHIGLRSSVPAKDSHVMTAPTEIRLTFTGLIDVAKAGIEFVDSANKAVATDSLRAVPDSVRVAVAKITGKMTGGTYTVRWKAVAADGAPGSGAFSFMYMAPK